MDDRNLSQTYSFHYKVSAEVGVELKGTPMGWPPPPHIKVTSMRWPFLPIPRLQDSI